MSARRGVVVTAPGKTTTTVRYWINDPEDDLSFEHYEDPEKGDYEAERAAEEAADDYHSNHDGWESSWPLVIVLIREDRSEIGRFDVDRESRPEFIAHRRPTP